MRLLRSALFAAAFAIASPAVAQTQQRTELQIHEYESPNGALFYSIPITIGRSHIDVLLDTGSTGLRILSRALAPNDATLSATPTQYGFGSGTHMSGVIARGALAIGALNGPADFALVQTVNCDVTAPDCPASRTSFEHFGIAGNGEADQGLLGIIGVGLRESGENTSNPLPAIGATSWIVDLPRPGDTTPGRLVLNPNADDLAGYTMIQLAPQATGAWLDNEVPVCLGAEARTEICLPGVFDSGAPGVLIGAHNPGAWPAHTNATLRVNAPDANLTASFVVGEQGARIRTIDPGPMPERAFLGTLPYYRFSVFYDATHGIIGIRPRP